MWGQLLSNLCQSFFWRFHPFFSASWDLNGLKPMSSTKTRWKSITLEGPKKQRWWIQLVPSSQKGKQHLKQQKQCRKPQGCFHFSHFFLNAEIFVLIYWFNAPSPPTHYSTNPPKPPTCARGCTAIITGWSEIPPPSNCKSRSVRSSLLARNSWHSAAGKTRCVLLARLLGNKTKQQVAFFFP